MKGFFFARMHAGKINANGRLSRIGQLVMIYVEVRGSMQLKVATSLLGRF